MEAAGPKVAAEAAVAEESAAWSVGSELPSWRLLAALEAGTLLLVVMALVLHALRTRAASTRRLRGQRVLITKGDSALGQALSRQFAGEGCSVSLLTSRNADAFASDGARILQCDARAENVRALAASVAALDVLVICGAEPVQQGLDDLANAVSEEVYSNFQLLEVLGGCMQAGGRVAWVCAGEGRGAYASATDSLHRVAKTLLNQVAKRSGCKAVWCVASCEPSEMAARVVRRLSQESVLPPSAEVFREYVFRVRDAAYVLFSRCSKIWT